MKEFFPTIVNLNGLAILIDWHHVERYREFITEQQFDSFNFYKNDRANGKSVNDYCKENGISRQRLHQRKSKALRKVAMLTVSDAVAGFNNEFPLFQDEGKPESESPSIFKLGLPFWMSVILFRAGILHAEQLRGKGLFDIAAINRIGPASANIIMKKVNEIFGDEQSGTPISILGLKPRTSNCLFRAGITTVEQLKVMSKEQIESLWQIGPCAVAEILDRLATYTDTE